MTEIPKINNADLFKPIALVAPLDWGLGHATRCIPVIHELLNAGFEVIIAASGDQEVILREEFPLLTFIPLKGYHLKYGTNKWLTIVKIIFQIPKVLIKIRQEKKWLHNQLFKYKHLALVVSDNRYGLQHSSLTSVFITHQLLIKTPLGNRMDNWLQKINYRFINRFTFCWIPDVKEGNNLAGALSHPAAMPQIPSQYIGPLSRIKKESLAVTNKLLILLSGPEPQRSIFEKIIMQQLKEFTEPFVLVRGLPSLTGNANAAESSRIFNHLPAKQLQRIMNQSEVILSRSGYSTIMDLLPLGKKCIFIPTPGQSEQEYLAGYLAAKGHCCTARQEDFSLGALMGEITALPARPPFSTGTEALRQAVEAVFSRVVSKQGMTRPATKT